MQIRRTLISGHRPPAYPSKATLAAELDISESTVDEWVRRGLLPKPIRRGGSVRWCWAQVEASMMPQPDAGDDDPFVRGIANVS